MYFGITISPSLSLSLFSPSVFEKAMEAKHTRSSPPSDVGIEADLPGLRAALLTATPASDIIIIIIIMMNG